VQPFVPPPAAHGGGGGGGRGAAAEAPAGAPAAAISEAATPAGMHTLADACLLLMEDEEPRVRVAVGEVLGALAAGHGPAVWLRAEGAVMASISSNYVSGGGTKVC